MKYFGLIFLLIALGNCADQVTPQSRNDFVSGSYGNVRQLKNYEGIFFPRFSEDRFGQRGYQGSFGQSVSNYYRQIGQNFGPGQNFGQEQNFNGQIGQLYGPGAQFFGQAGGVIGNWRNQRNIGIAGGLGLAAALDLSAGLGAGFAGNLGNAIGVGINGNLELNLDANIDINNREDLVRPCNLDDWQCMRKFFASNSQCSPAYGPVPDPLFLDQSTLYFPLINANILQTNVRVTGLGGARMRDFYVNRVTGNLVLTLDIQNLNETSPRSYMKYHRRGKESIILADVSAILFSQLSLTVVIPRLPNLRLDLAEIHADYDENNSPRYDFGPGIFNSTDSLVLSANTQLSANLQAVARESFLFQAQLLAAIYIQQNICDFGLKLSSS